MLDYYCSSGNILFLKRLKFMQYDVRIGEDHLISLHHEDFDQNVDVDELTTIDTSNLFGEAVTVSASANRIGMLKSVCQSNMDLAKLEQKIYISKFISKLRKVASENAGFYFQMVDGAKIKIKLTEKGLETCYQDDPEYIRITKQLIREEKNFNNLSSLYWSVQSKDRKLNSIVGGTTPREFVDGLVEGKVNGIFVKKKTRLGTAPSLGS